MSRKLSWSREEIDFIFDCRKMGITYLEIVNLFATEFGRKTSPTRVQSQLSKAESWIYMLKDEMTREEALDDYFNHQNNPVQLQWKNHPEWLETFEMHMGKELREITYILYTQHGIKTTVSGLSTLKMRRYKDTIKPLNNQRATAGKNAPIKYSQPIVISPDVYVKPGYSLKYSVEQLPVICYARGHETMKWFFAGKSSSGCSECNNERPKLRYHNPLEAGIFYWGDLIDSNLNDFKLGKTLERIGVDKRAKNYGTFDYEEVHKPIGEVEEFEQYMKLRYEKYSTHNPMLKENGSTECFDKIVLPDLKWFINIWTTKGLPEVKTRLDMALKI